MSIVDALKRRLAKKAADVQAEYRDLLRKAIKAGDQLKPADQSKLEQLTDQMSISPVQVKQDLETVREYDLAMSRIGDRELLQKAIATAQAAVDVFLADDARIKAEQLAKENIVHFNLAQAQQALQMSRFNEGEAHAAINRNPDLFSVAETPRLIAPEKSSLELHAQNLVGQGQAGREDPRTYEEKVAEKMRELRAQELRRDLVKRRGGKVQHAGESLVGDDSNAHIVVTDEEEQSVQEIIAGESDLLQPALVRARNAAAAANQVD